MRTDRKWIALAALTFVPLLAACSGGGDVDTTPPPPPRTLDETPTTDVAPSTAPAGPVDETERRPPQSLQEMQADLERSGLIGDVYYDFDKYELRPDARGRLAKNAEFMRSPQGSHLSFVLEGHCDERGTNEYNLALGQSRSTTALDYLVSLGVDSSRFKIISYGEERPFCSESSEACWQRNRRARFVISGQSGG